MKSILYYEHNEKSKSLDKMRPIYYEGPFWAFWLIEIFDKIANFGLDIRFKIEDRLTFPVAKDKRVGHKGIVYN